MELGGGLVTPRVQREHVEAIKVQTNIRAITSYLFKTGCDEDAETDA